MARNRSVKTCPYTVHAKRCAHMSVQRCLDRFIKLLKTSGHFWKCLHTDFIVMLRHTGRGLEGANATLILVSLK